MLESFKKKKKSAFYFIEMVFLNVNQIYIRIVNHFNTINDNGNKTPVCGICTYTLVFSK